MDGASGDMKDSVPFVEDEDSAGREGGFGVSAGGVSNNDLGVVNEGDC